MRFKILFLLITIPIAIAASDPVVSVRYKIIRVDRVEHVFYGAGQRKPVVGVFSTVYKFKGKHITATEFWEKISPKDEVDAKVRVKELFNVAAASNLSIDTP